MNLSVSGQQIEIGEALQSHARQALAGVVTKYFTDALDGQVHFSREAYLFRADILVHVGRNISMQSHASAVDPYGAFDAACEHLAKRLRRHKRRLREHTNRAARAEEGLNATQTVFAAPEPLHDDEPAPGASDDPVVIAEMRTAIETLSVGEAVLRLDFTGQPAMLFRSRANGLLNMVYRRPDGNIGWVDPQNLDHA